MLKAIARGRFSIPGNVSPDARDLISKMMAVDARKRIKLDAIRQHPWLNPPKAPARPKRLENMRQQSVDAKQNRKEVEKTNGKRGKSRKESVTKTVLKGRRSQNTSVDGLKVSAEMVRCIFGVFKKHYRHKVSWKAMKQDSEFEHYLELLGDIANVRFEKLSDPEWKVSSPPPPVLVPALHPLVRLRTALLPRLLGPVRPALGWPAQAQLCTPISLSVCISA
jgi:serine/threonine protein kinase